MTARPSWDEYFMSLARLAATRSTCVRRRVGAVIVKDRMVLSTGYNDTPRGMKNCGDGGCERCRSGAAAGTALDSCLCLHAEQNAIIQAAYHGVGIAGGTIYSTHQPCLTCAKMIVNSGILRIVYQEPYPDALAEQLLREAAVEFVRVDGAAASPAT
ncbi:MAG TPA: cytidine/deoxycytidylate deaminase family protein [bacterium]|nr:cytidine/deoxycytidylate deaminase family protein [bacterium]